MIYVICNDTSPRLEYVLTFMFKEIYETSYRVVPRLENRVQEESRIIYYGQKPKPGEIEQIAGSIFVPKHDLLFEQGITKQDIVVLEDPVYGQPYFFGEESNETQNWRFDIFAMIFYCLSRYEEYLPCSRDGFGRFPAVCSIAVQHNFLQKPIVDIWMHIFVKSLFLEKYPKTFKKQQFAIYPTIDIDRVWAYAHAGNNRFAGLFKDIVLFRFSNVLDRLRSFRDPLEDPFFTFPYLEEVLKKSTSPCIYFILYSKLPDKLDINHPRELPEFSNWLTQFSLKHDLALHPSFQSHFSSDHLTEEKEALETAIHKTITASRQHYILFNLPETYNRLIQAGITSEYSMGFPEALGYRASTGYSFFWYDLSKETSTNLIIHPFQAMDVTMKKYVKFLPDQAIKTLSAMIEEAKRAGSPFRFIWHNSSFYAGSGWKNWKKVFEHLLSSGHS